MGSFLLDHLTLEMDTPSVAVCAEPIFTEAQTELRRLGLSHHVAKDWARGYLMIC